MRRMKKQRCTADRSADTESMPSHLIPQLPAWKAFVVQFNRDADADPAGWAGRVEHLSSGHRARFNTPQELLRTLERLLDELCRTPVDQV